MMLDGSSTLGRRSKTGFGDGAHTTKPKLALALGSGAARGWVHIGIIKRLARAGIRPDIIAGTSIGALVGGCETAGVLDALEEFAIGLTRRRVFALLDFPWRGGSLIGGNKLTDLLQDILGDKRIENLPRQFAAIATELATGHEIWLNEGNLVAAMRASYALPGIFPPVEIDGKWLIDGAVVNPIPISICRAMGARYVVAVNLNTDPIGTGTVIQNAGLGSKRKPAARGKSKKGKSGTFRNLLTGGPDGPGISTTMIAAYTISQDRLARSRMAGDPPNLVIAPKGAHEIGLFDFDKAKEAIEVGEQAVQRVLPEIESALIALDNQAGS